MNSPVSALNVGRIVSVSLHQIDVDGQTCKEIKITKTGTDLESYLDELLSEIEGKNQKRAYEFDSEGTEFYSSLQSYIASQDLSSAGASDSLAKRLLKQEVIADKKYGHLGATGKGHVKKGSFLQFLYKDGKEITFLGVKIEHQTFLDEVDFRKRIGLSVSNKIYKACRVGFDGKKPKEVHVYDTNNKPSVYWWESFLELKQARK